MRMRAVSAILAMIIAAGANASRAAHAQECLAGPNGASPSGKHWYYRIDRSTHRKCWYLGALDGRRQRASSARASPAARDAEPTPPQAAEPAPASASAPAPQPAFGTRWQAQAPSVAADGAQPQDRVAAAGVAVLPDRIAARPVPVERVAREPAAPKPPEAATVRLAAAAPPAAASPAAAPAPGSNALPAALFGIALLLAVLGTMLVLARRRFMVRITDAPAIDSPSLAPGRDEHVAKLFVRLRRLRGALADARDDEAMSPARRSLHEILAKASGPDEREARHPGLPSNPNTRSRIPLRSMRATGDDTDIASATLQPAIDPLPPEPIAPAPDVEQSLRQLLAAWERRAA